MQRSFSRMSGLLLTLCLAGSWQTQCQASVEPELTMAVGHKDLAQVQSLLSKGVDVNETDEGSEQTPLMRAAQVGDVAITEILLTHGAKVNAQDDFGKTALLFAVEKGATSVVALLLERGAQPAIKDAKGRSALSLAMAKGYTQIANRLRQQAGSFRQGVSVTKAKHPVYSLLSAR